MTNEESKKILLDAERSYLAGYRDGLRDARASAVAMLRAAHDGPAHDGPAGGRDAARIWAAFVRGVLLGPEAPGPQAWGADRTHVWATADQVRRWLGGGRSAESIGRVLKRARDPEVHDALGRQRANGRLLSGGWRKVWKIARETLVAHAEVDGEELSRALDRATHAMPGR